jgi:uncharacterized protein YkwD
MKFGKNTLVVSTLATALVLSACGGGTTTSATATPSATPTPTPSPSATPTPTPTPVPTPTPAPTPTAAECPFGDYKSAVVAEINAIRSKPQVCGGVNYPAVGSLGWNGQLESAAAVHSTDMAVNNFFDHPGSDGLRIGARTSAAGYAYSKVGENIAAGQSSASQVSADWLASASHCSNMMTASFVDIGVSCKTNPSATYVYYWTLVMGNH